MPAIPPHNTKVIDMSWDGPAEEAKISNDAGASTLRRMYAWVDPDKNADTKGAYKFPHHEVVDGSPGPAVLSGVRAAMSRVGQSQTQIPEGDRSGVREHLQRHLDAQGGSSLTEMEVGAEHSYRRSAWGLVPEVMADVKDYLAGRWSQSKIQARAAEASLREQPIGGQSGSLAVIPLQGLITPRSTLLSLLFGGGGGLQGFRAAFREAMNDASVETILLEVDSPGGLVDLVPETAAEVRAARGTKKVVAHANVRAASAAYWIASQAEEFVVSPSGEVGSIGVFVAHEDISQAEEMHGIKTTLISAGKYKTEGNPYEPLSADARNALQGFVDELYAMFTADVAEGRGTSAQAVQNGFGQGRLELAADAVRLGMADRVESFEQTLLRLGAAPTDADELDQPSEEPCDVDVPDEEAIRMSIADMLLPS